MIQPHVQGPFRHAKMLPGYTCVKPLSGNTLTLVVAVTVIVATAPRYGWQSPGTGPVRPFYLLLPCNPGDIARHMNSLCHTCPHFHKVGRIYIHPYVGDVPLLCQSIPLLDADLASCTRIRTNNMLKCLSAYDEAGDNQLPPCGKAILHTACLPACAVDTTVRFALLKRRGRGFIPH